MPTRRAPRPASRPARSSGSGQEWIGARVTAPLWVGADEPFQPELCVWMELPEGIIVGMHLVDPDGPEVSFGDTLVGAMKEPSEGRPRRPGFVRVANEEMADEVRRVLPDVPIMVAPTPEFGEFLESLKRMPAPPGASEDSWDPKTLFPEGDRVGPEAGRRFFRATEALHRLAPWKSVSDGFVIRVDIPALGVTGGCLSIMGQLGEHFGLVLFPSFEAYERFGEAGEAQRQPIDLGTSFLSLEFVAGSELPPGLHRKFQRNGWPVAGKEAFPILSHLDRHGEPKSVPEGDVRVMTACAASLASCFAAHPTTFREESDDDPICESYVDGDGVETRLTVPYEAWELFEPESSENTSTVRLKSGSAVEGSTGARPIEEATMARLDAYAVAKFGRRWMAEAATCFKDPNATLGLFVPWAFYGQVIRGKTLPKWYAADPRCTASPEELAWLDAQQAAWLSIWEVTAVEPGTSVALLDRLSGETRLVSEKTASRTVVRGDHFLGRVVDHAGQWILCGVHPQPLQPSDGERVIERFRKRRKWKGIVSVDELRKDGVGGELIVYWERVVGEVGKRLSRPPDLRNTSGHVLQPTEDRFVFKAEDRPDIFRRLAALKDLDRLDDSGTGEETGFDIIQAGNPKHRGMEATILGRVFVAAEGLRIEANSVERADDHRRRFEGVLAKLVRFKERALQDVMAPPTGPPPDESEDKFLDSPELAAMALTMKSKHYADWVDHPLPALGNRTPRTVARTKSGRRQLDLLLKDMENHEARLPESQRYDFSGIRAELGLGG